MGTMPDAGVCVCVCMCVCGGGVGGGGGSGGSGVGGVGGGGGSGGDGCFGGGFLVVERGDLILFLFGEFWLVLFVFCWVGGGGWLW